MNRCEYCGVLPRPGANQCRNCGAACDHTDYQEQAEWDLVEREQLALRRARSDYFLFLESTGPTYLSR